MSEHAQKNPDGSPRWLRHPGITAGHIEATLPRHSNAAADADTARHWLANRVYFDGMEPFSLVGQVILVDADGECTLAPSTVLPPPDCGVFVIDDAMVQDVVSYAELGPETDMGGAA
jgi:hypothetical protein